MRSSGPSFRAPGSGLLSDRRESDHHLGVATDEVGLEIVRLPQHLDVVEPRQQLLPQDAELHLRQPAAHAAVHADAEREMVTGVVPADDEVVGILEGALITVARGVPHHDLVALADELTIQNRVLLGDPTHVGQRRLPTDDLVDQLRDEPMVGPEAIELLRELVERQHAARHRIAGGVVATDDKQDEVAEKLHRPIDQVLGVLRHLHQRDQVVARLLACSAAGRLVVPQRTEALRHVGDALVHRVHVGRSAGAGRTGSGQVCPVHQLAALLVREVEQGGEHPRGQLDADLVDPVEGLVDWQVVEHLLNARADQPLHLLEVLRGHDTLNSSTLLVVTGRVHGDEHLDVQAVWRVADDDLRLGGVGLEVLVHGHDVVVPGHRPVRPEGAVGLVVHRRFVAQTFEIGPPLALAEEEWVAEVDLGQRDLVDVGDLLLDEDRLVVTEHQLLGLLEQVQPLDLPLHRDRRLGLVDDLVENAHGCSRLRVGSVV